MLHQQVVGSSEHQIRLSKGVIALFVIPLGFAIQADAPAARVAPSAPLSLTHRYVDGLTVFRK
jgi:hypothetical protein